MEITSIKRLNRILTYLFEEMKVLDDCGRDLPIRWNMMHMYTSTQLAKLIALKRHLDIELSGLIAALHDIAVVRTKRRANHALEAKRFVIEIVNTYNNEIRGNLPIITESELDIIIEAIIHHSEKDIISDSPYVELMKDVDSIDRFLHGIKTEEEYLIRCKKVFNELNLPYIV